jgi:hypothetical protein
MKTLLLTIALLGLTSCFESQKRDVTVQAKDGLNGTDGKSGSSCKVIPAVGSATIRCDDGSSAVIKDGQSVIGSDGKTIVGPKGDKGDAGLPGKSCSVEQTRAGAIIRCGDGTTATVSNGAPGPSVQGLPGRNGANSILQQFQATKEQCANGGVLIVSFLDINADGRYNSGTDQNLQQTLLCNQVLECPCKDDHHHDDKPCDKHK